MSRAACWWRSRRCGSNARRWRKNGRLPHGRLPCPTWSLTGSPPELADTEPNRPSVVSGQARRTGAGCWRLMADRNGSPEKRPPRFGRDRAAGRLLAIAGPHDHLAGAGALREAVGLGSAFGRGAGATGLRAHHLFAGSPIDGAKRDRESLGPSMPSWPRVEVLAGPSPPSQGLHVLPDHRPPTTDHGPRTTDRRPPTTDGLFGSGSAGLGPQRPGIADPVAGPVGLEALLADLPRFRFSVAVRGGSGPPAAFADPMGGRCRHAEPSHFLRRFPNHSRRSVRGGGQIYEGCRSLVSRSCGRGTLSPKTLPRSGNVERG